MSLTGIVLAGVVVAVAIGCAGGARRNRFTERTVANFATVRVPRRLEQRPLLLNDWFGTSIYFTRSMNSIAAMGSSSPQHENLLVTLLHPVLVHTRGIELLDHVPQVFEYTKDVVWEPASEKNNYKLRFGVARYTPNLLDKPALLAQAFDVARGLAVSYRGLAEEINQDQIGTLIDSVMSSWKPMTDPPTWFSSIDRDLGPVAIAFPIELTDPYPMQKDSSGVAWIFFRRYREWAEDPALPEQSIAIAVFFDPRSGPQAAAAGRVLSTNAAQEFERIGLPQSVGEVHVEALRHAVGGHIEPAWMAYSVNISRGIGVAYRSWQKNISAEGAAQVVQRAMASYRFSGDSTFFAPPLPE